jgi:hypothetical protein
MLIDGLYVTQMPLQRIARVETLCAIDKASSTGNDTPVLEILAAIGILALILSILIGAGLYIRKRTN